MFYMSVLKSAWGFFVYFGSLFCHPYEQDQG